MEAQQQNPNAVKQRPPMGLIANAKKNKHSFIQFFIMTGVLLMSVRSLSQKYRLDALQQDTAALREEQEKLSDRMSGIKTALIHEAELDSSGVFAARLRKLFGDAE